MRRKRAEERAEPRVLEKGHIYFFYRPKIERLEVEEGDDIQRFYVVFKPLAKRLYRMLIIGHKKMAQLEERRAEFAFVGKLFRNKEELTQEMGRKKYFTKALREREVPAAQTMGSGSYLLVEEGRETHLVYLLNIPEQTGDLEGELAVGREGSYLLSIKSPLSSSEKGLNREPKAIFPPELQKKFGKRRFIAPDSADFLNYENAELLLIAERIRLEERIKQQLRKIPPAEAA